MNIPVELKQAQLKTEAIFHVWVFGTSETGRHSDTCIAINKDMVKNIYFTRDAPEEAIYIHELIYNYTYV